MLPLFGESSAHTLVLWQSMRICVFVPVPCTAIVSPQRTASVLPAGSPEKTKVGATFGAVLQSGCKCAGRKFGDAAMVKLAWLQSVGVPLGSATRTQQFVLGIFGTKTVAEPVFAMPYANEPHVLPPSVDKSILTVLNKP